MDTKGSIKINSTPIGIELIDLNFHYGDGINVLENINLNIPPNSTVCITGPEGSGKSTLMNLIAGTYSDFTGVLMYNNCLLYTSPSPRDRTRSRMPSSA